MMEQVELLRQSFGLCFLEPRMVLEVLIEVVDPEVVEEAMDEYCPDCLPSDQIVDAIELMMENYIEHPVLALSMDTAQAPDEC